MRAHGKFHGGKEMAGVLWMVSGSLAEEAAISEAMQIAQESAKANTKKKKKKPGQRRW